MLEARLYIWSFTKKSLFTILFLGIIRNFLTSWLIIFTIVFVLGWPISCFIKNLLRPSREKEVMKVQYFLPPKFLTVN